MEAEVLTRLEALAERRRDDPAESLQRRRAAASAAVEYVLDAVEHGEEGVGPPPVTLLTHARLAARAGIPLDKVLRLYFAGYAVIADFLLQEVQSAGPQASPSPREITRAQAAIFDRLIRALADEYEKEAARQVPRSPQRRLTATVARLLAGEPIDASHLNYDLAGFHLAAVVNGKGADSAVPLLAAAVDRQSLVVPRGETSAWAWFGGRRPFEMSSLVSQLGTALPGELRIALGEPGSDLSGWRLSHRQATAAAAVFQINSKQLIRYGDIPLLASALHDDVLSASLRSIFLKPLSDTPDEGRVLQDTLRAYFAADRNVSSAAAVLRVSRRTVANRLRVIEERLARPLGACAKELEVALLLEREVEPPREGDAARPGLESRSGVEP